ncbi:MAG: spore protease [Bacillota bacterium]|nr:spore protease [Bacillota bacterium]MDK2927203.1 spore protease [Bacillota bacterium]
MTAHGLIRTDLALEAREALLKEARREVAGIETSGRTTAHTRVTRVKVTSEAGARRLGKPPGTYITIEAPELRQGSRVVASEVAEVLTAELGALASLPEKAGILVIGLGNWNATPDALGPRVVDSVMVTRHLFEYAPQELKGGLRSVAALAPGVLGLTGIETEEIVKGVVQHIQPDLVVAIDALAARSLERVCTTVQLSDSGIHPGSGVGNKRLGLTAESLGTRVIAVGVPTVVHATTLASDALDLMLGTLSRADGGGAKLAEAFTPAERQKLVRELLPDHWEDLFITPKEIDALIADTARVLASGLNAALHPRVTAAEGERYLQ